MSILRIALWSGPRNISTAMMRAWENRTDTWVVDEPLYAHYLKHTGRDHPGRDAILASGETDWRKVTAGLTSDVQPGKSIYFQKHMTHHLLPHIDRDWLGSLSHVFLIRDPRAVLASYLRSRRSVVAEDLGIVQQLEIYEYVRRQFAGDPPVVDAAEFLRDPEAHLRALCEHLAIGFTPRMLHWPAGPRSSDGVWAPYWYTKVIASSGFEPATSRRIEVPREFRELIGQVQPAYERLRDQCASTQRRA